MSWVLQSIVNDSEDANEAGEIIEHKKMPAQLTGNEILLRVSNVRSKKGLNGSLRLLSTRMIWKTDLEPAEAITVDFKYDDIKGLKISPEGWEKIRLQIVMLDGSHYTFHFCNPGGTSAQLSDRDAVKEMLLQLLPKFKRPTQTESDFNKKQSILPNCSAGSQLADINAGNLGDLLEPVPVTSLPHAITSSTNRSLQLEDVLDLLGLVAQTTVSSTACRLNEVQSSLSIEQIDKLCGESTDLRVASNVVWYFEYLQEHMDSDVLAGHLGIIFDIVNKLLPLDTAIAQLNSRPSLRLGSLLSFLSNVMTRLPTVLVGLRDKWLLYAFNLSVCEAPLLHERALVVLRMLQGYSANEKTEIELSVAVRNALKSHIAKEMIRLFGVGHQSHVMILWGVIIQLLGRRLHDGASLLNALLPVIEVGCKVKNNEEIVKLIFKNWRILIQNFALDPILVLAHQRRLKLILQLFHKPAPLETEAVSEAKTIAWWTLIVCLGDQLFEHRLDVLVSFLRFCVGGDIVVVSHADVGKFHADFGKPIVVTDNRVSIAIPDKLCANLPQTLPSFENPRALLGEVLLNLFYGGAFDVVSFTRTLDPLTSALLTNPAFPAADFIPFLVQCIRAWFHSVSASDVNCEVCSLCWLAVFKQLRKIHDIDKDGRLLGNVVVQFCQFLKENLSLDKTKQLEFLKLLADSLTVTEDNCLSPITFPEDRGSFGLLLWRTACEMLPVNAASAVEILISILSQSAELVFSDPHPTFALTKGHSLLRRIGKNSSLSVSALSSLWITLAEKTTSFLQNRMENLQVKIATSRFNAAFVVDLHAFPVAKLTYEECDKMEQVFGVWKILFIESVRYGKFISSFAPDSFGWLICRKYSKAVKRLVFKKKKGLLPRGILRLVAFTCKLVCEESSYLDIFSNCRSYKSSASHKSSGGKRRTQLGKVGRPRHFAAVLERCSNSCFREPIDRLDVAAAIDLSFAISQLFKHIQEPVAMRTTFLQFVLSMRNIARLLNEEMHRQLTKLTPNLEQALLAYLQAAHDRLTFDRGLLRDSAPLFALALNHSRLPVRKSATKLWKRLFAQRVTSQNCPASLKGVLLALKAECPQPCPLLTEPTLNISNDQTQSDQTASMVLLDEGQGSTSSPAAAALVDSTEKHHQVFVIPKAEPGSVSHAVDGAENVIRNEFTVKIAPEASVVLADEIRCWMLQAAPIKGELYYYYRKTYLKAPAEDQLTPKCLSFYRDFFVHDDGPARHRLLERLLEVRTLPADYPIPKLRGQRGVFARVCIPADTILGLYSGIILREGSADAKSRDLQAELGHLDDLNPAAFYTDRFLAKYAVGLPLCADFMKRNEDCWLTVSALQRGNCLSLINAYLKKDNRPNVLTAARLNTASTIVRMDSHVPVVLLYASKEIAANEQLFLDYGADYFQPVSQPIDVDRLDIADASEVGWINRFVRDANDATGDFVLKLASVDELEKATTELIRERVGQFTVCDESLTLKISSANMAAAISKQRRIPADIIEEENKPSNSRSKKVPSEERHKRLGKRTSKAIAEPIADRNSKSLKRTCDDV